MPINRRASVSRAPAIKTQKVTSIRSNESAKTSIAGIRGGGTICGRWDLAGSNNHWPTKPTTTDNKAVIAVATANWRAIRMFAFTYS